jgi:hypothetical protein
VTFRQLNHLVSQGIVREYPPLVDVRGCMTAQYVRIGQTLSQVYFFTTGNDIGTHHPVTTNGKGSCEPR